MAQWVKNPPAVQETRVQSLGWKDSLEEGMAIYSSILAWRIPMDIGAWRAAVHEIAKSQIQLKQLRTYARHGFGTESPAAQSQFLQTTRLTLSFSDL